MSFDKYFQRQNFTSSLNLDFKDIDFFVVIPVFADELIFKTLDSIELALKKFSDNVCIIIVINHSISASDEEKKLNYEIELKLRNSSSNIQIITKYDIPEKEAGVGFARKTGMDEAAYHLYKTNKKDGIIISLDADTTVATNYFTAIEKFFTNNPNSVGANIYFEHPIFGNEFEPNIYNAIILYELHLRYFVQALRKLNYPWAFHTIGSAFAVRVKNYVASQGISKRQGGEDFYFLNKLFAQGQFGEINDTYVYPSPRPTNKTPFGTGIAIKKIIDQKEQDFYTFLLKSFICTEPLLNSIDKLWNLDFENINICKQLETFLEKRNFYNKIEKVKNNSSTFQSFEKSFFRLFDTFEIIKFLNEISTHEDYKKQSIVLEANKLLETNLEAKELLLKYREIQRNSTYLYSYQQ